MMNESVHAPAGTSDLPSNGRSGNSESSASLGEILSDIAAPLCQPASLLTNDLIKSSLEYLDWEQRLLARELNQEWSRAVADVVESCFSEEEVVT